MLQDKFSCPSGYPVTDAEVKISNKNLSSGSQPNIQLISPSEIKNTIKYLPRRKAPGPDGILNSTLQKLSDKTILHITNIFNFCPRLNYFFKIFKKAAIIMILKPGKNHKLPSIYRPISLLNTTSKMLDIALLTRLKSAKIYKIRPEQFAF